MKYTFNHKVEERQNPWCGIMSFQHFTGEKMYSDIVVRPENRMLETEPVECYPVAPDAKENGRAEGYYPENTIAYLRIIWKTFEPERGVYNYDFIQDFLDQARAHGQTVMFRLMAHSTRPEDDVPDWLKELIPCPERPAGKRVKDSPTDPLFIDLFLDAVRAFGARFDSDPTLDMVDISLPGAWGEGFKLELYPDDIMIRIADAYMEAFPTTQLMTQFIRPNIIKHVGQFRPIGWRADGFGEPNHMVNWFPCKIEQFPDNWKTAPVSFESYWWLCEWKRKGWDIDEIIAKSLEWHISSFNPKSMPIPYEWQDKIEAWLAKMGYHFTVKSAEIPETINGKGNVAIEIENVGVAPLYKNVPFVIRLEKDGVGYDIVTDADVRTWLPGTHTITADISLPEGADLGKYELMVGIKGENTPRIYLATDAERKGDYYKLADVIFA